MVESQNELSNAIYQADKLKDEPSIKELSKEDQQSLGQAIADAQQKASSKKVDEVKSATTKLKKVLSDIQAKMIESINKSDKDDKKDEAGSDKSDKSKKSKKADKAAEAEIVKDEKSDK